MNQNIDSNVKLNLIKNNYDSDFPDNIQLFSNEFQNFIKKEDFIPVQHDLNRISNLKDNDLPLEDKLQIQKQINDDNDNDDQIEVIENILNNFDKEKIFNNKKFLMYKNKNNKKNKYKSSSVINRNNKILNKIKNDIALINFQQELNQIHKLHNYKIFLNSERAYINNSIKKNNERENGLDYNENKNKKRIDDLKKKLYPKNKEQNENKTSYKDIKKLINVFNINRKKEDLFNSKNEKEFNHILDELNILKKSKLDNNICKTSRTLKKNTNDNYNNINEKTNQKIITTINNSNKNQKTNEENYDILITDESTKISNNTNSNQFFYNVYKNSVKKYPYLYLLRNKINKMRYAEISKNKKKIRERNGKDRYISLLEKINSQKNIFQKEIDEIYKSK
jgi:hypothetical protein